MQRSPNTIYSQIREYLRSRIHDGIYKPGDRLPSERDLALLLDVSRGSIRVALQQLETEGVIARFERIGYFVGPSLLTYEPDKLATFTRTIGMRGHRPGAIVLHVGEELPTREIREYLRLPIGETIHRIKRLRLASNRPVVIETVHLPSSLCPNLIDRDLGNKSLWGIMTSDYGVKLTYAEINLRLTALDEQQASLLDVPSGSPALFLTRLTFDDAKQPIELDHEIYRGDSTEFHIRAST